MWHRPKVEVAAATGDEDTAWVRAQSSCSDSLQDWWLVQEEVFGLQDLQGKPVFPSKWSLGIMSEQCCSEFNKKHLCRTAQGSCKTITSETKGWNLSVPFQKPWYKHFQEHQIPEPTPTESASLLPFSVLYGFSILQRYRLWYADVCLSSFL